MEIKTVVFSKIENFTENDFNVLINNNLIIKRTNESFEINSESLVKRLVLELDENTATQVFNSLEKGLGSEIVKALETKTINMVILEGNNFKQEPCETSSEFAEYLLIHKYKYIQLALGVLGEYDESFPKASGLYYTPLFNGLYEQYKNAENIAQAISRHLLDDYGNGRIDYFNSIYDLCIEKLKVVGEFLNIDVGDLLSVADEND